MKTQIRPKLSDNLLLVIIAILILVSGMLQSCSKNPLNEESTIGLNYEDLECSTVTLSRYKYGEGLYEDVELVLYSIELDSMDYGDESAVFYNQCPDAVMLNLNLNDSILLINDEVALDVSGCITIHGITLDGTKF